MRLQHPYEMANCVGHNQTAPYEQSDWGLHSLLSPTYLNTLIFYFVFMTVPEIHCFRNGIESTAQIEMTSQTD